MNLHPLRSSLPLLLALTVSLAIPGLALAESMVSTASSAGSASVGSLSDSLQGSSASSTGGPKVADGDYEVLDVAAAPDRAGVVRLQMRPRTDPRQATPKVAAEAADDRGNPPTDTLTLVVPERALGARGMAAGDIVGVRNRPYGLEFARAVDGGAREAFFLALNDAWRRELDARPVSF